MHLHICFVVHDIEILKEYFQEKINLSLSLSRFPSTSTLCKCAYQALEN